MTEPAGGRRRVLVATLDSLTARRAGPAIRAWEFATELSRHHEVTLVSFTACELASERFACKTIVAEDFAAEVERHDVVVVQGYVFRGFGWLHDVPQKIVVDWYDPLHLETIEVDRFLEPERRRVSSALAVYELNAQAARGDAFLAASPKQRDLWLGQLAAAGRVNPETTDGDPELRRLLPVVPFGLDPVRPHGTSGRLRSAVPGLASGDLVLLWGGGVYNWFDPLTLIRAVDELRHEVPQLRLVFLGMRHPNPDVPAMAMADSARTLAAERGLVGAHVFFNEGWVPHGERYAWLSDADIGVSTHFRTLETEFSFRTRILDYLWAGLPIVTTDGDGFADLVRQRDLGAVVPAEDVTALADALRPLLLDPAHRAACAARVLAASAEFEWPRVLRPLVELCTDPSRAPDAARLGPAPVPPSEARPSLGRDLRTTWRHLRDGGPARVVDAARARLDRRRRLGI